MNIAIAIAAVTFLFSLWLVFKPKSTTKRVWGGGNNFSKLVVACLGDREKANRLVAYEQKRFPYADKDSLAEIAIDRLQRDRS